MTQMGAQTTQGQCLGRYSSTILTQQRRVLKLQGGISRDTQVSIFGMFINYNKWETPSMVTLHSSPSLAPQSQPDKSALAPGVHMLTAMAWTEVTSAEPSVLRGRPAEAYQGQEPEACPRGIPAATALLNDFRIQLTHLEVLLSHVYREGSLELFSWLSCLEAAVVQL